ncbi:hypothetical protein A2856_03285 [Candidatus Uhrbacteria bacterium RIFCSPHIGHO2_01_FULL_63_20]|uniref:Peptidase C39-like domain-containing protein n=1 Tax=Candidatus Uhrbacteria bacterium RIFCSPHIGHO2_01_FULL_63_20 TaxID=1802385 RepID=A0A1F7TLB7_9BACT|nr:MAG: hypothetical protein A2856_03285 [Candidatus Uhrbacteria bacterium RIFCSPHIGHO2_01_FULL_63_20]
MHLRAKLILIPFAIAAAAFLYANRVAVSDVFRAAAQPPLPPAITYEEVVETGDDEGGPVAGERSETPRAEDGPPSSLGPVSPADELPSAFNLAVPFTPQAPFANWDEVHEETCEEASVYMVERFYGGQPSGLIDARDAEKALLSLVETQRRLFGFFEDTTARQTGLFAKEAYGVSSTVIEDPSAEDLKRLILSGRPVLVPAAGRELHNPFFTGEGPLYHMIVLRGWTEEGFIVNDPGTRRGEGYVYGEATIMEAMDDWDPATAGLSGAKRVLVIEPNEP